MNPETGNISVESNTYEDLVPDTKGVFNSRDGTTLYYETYGSGRPLIFCYGLLCRREHWRHQLRHFAGRYRVIQFDYRGHQYSGNPANDRHLTLEWCARDIQDVLDHLGITEVVCFGHSMGVPILTHLLPWEKERVKASVFVCGTVTNPFENMFYSSRMNRVYRLTEVLYDAVPGVMEQVWRKFTEHNRLNYFLTSRLGFNASQAEKRDVLNYMEGVNQTPFRIFNGLMGDYTRYDGRKKLPDIACPVLVLAGEEDCVTPFSLQQEIAALIPRSETYRVPAGSHNAHLDFPNVVNFAIDDFLAKTGYV